jgi:glutathione S-transferase
MLELAQMPYDSVLYWDSKEFKDYAPFGQLPLLTGNDLDDEDQVLCQSSAIVRYIARETNLDGSESGAVGEARADMVFECSKDLSASKTAIHATVEADKEKFHGQLKMAEELLTEFEGPYFSGMAVTYADVGMFHQLVTVEELKPGYLKKNGFEVRHTAMAPNHTSRPNHTTSWPGHTTTRPGHTTTTPTLPRAPAPASCPAHTRLACHPPGCAPAPLQALSVFVERFAALPPIANYLSSPRRMPLTANEVGDKPWAADGYKYKVPLSAEPYLEEYKDEEALMLDGDDDEEDDDDDEDEDEEEEEPEGKRASKKARK